MPYLIDGHNLIPKIPGLDLKAMDDETQLIEILQEFCRRRRKQAEIYFDNSPAGQPHSRKYGFVLARFIRQGQVADNAIHDRLERLGKAARNWTVVSSDQAVQAAARNAHAHYISSEAFSKEIVETLQDNQVDLDQKPDASLSAEEVKDWMEFFRKRTKGKA
jgi:predicted RNA-binding protein with PIN domain